MGGMRSNAQPANCEHECMKKLGALTFIYFCAERDITEGRPAVSSYATFPLVNDLLPSYDANKIENFRG